MQYDFVGAPWHRDNERWSKRTAVMTQGVGNGGLSLRSVPAMLALSRRFGGNVTHDGQQVGGAGVLGGAEACGPAAASMPSQLSGAPPRLLVPYRPRPTPRRRTFFTPCTWSGTRGASTG